jgi:hypothetical protein
MSTFNPSAYSNDALKVMLKDDAFKAVHAAIEAHLAPKPVATVQPERRPVDTGKKYTNINRDLTAVSYSKGYVRLETKQPAMLLWEDDAKALIEYLEDLIVAGRLDPRR